MILPSRKSAQRLGKQKMFKIFERTVEDLRKRRDGQPLFEGVTASGMAPAGMAPLADK